jgi:beta-glucosidase
MIDEAVAAAGQADTVVAALGDSFGMSGEGACRTDIGLPESQTELLRALVKTGKPLVLVLMESKEITFTITTNDLKFFNSELKYDWEPGKFIIRIGPNSSELHSASVQWDR